MAGDTPSGNTPLWQWNEYQQVGTDYDDIEQVRAYDERMGKFRDIEAENRRVLDALNLKPTDTMIEIGCGTGNLSIAATRQCRQVIAYDISDIMLQYAAGKAEALGVPNIEFHKAGFLTCHEKRPPVDAVVSQFALHHLPDFWKAVAIQRIAAMLNMGGHYYLTDVIFSFGMPEFQKHFDAWPESLGRESRDPAFGHLAREYSTQDWIIEGMFARSGFSFINREIDSPMIARYLVQKG